MKLQPLHKMQILFQKSIVQNFLSAELSSEISEKPPIDVPARLKIYQVAYQSRMTESLSDDFPYFQEKLGEERFAELIEKFIQNYPSKLRNLSEYSESFLNYLLESYEENFIDQNGIEIVECAIKDWLSLLAARSEALENILSLSEISDGAEFNLTCHPSVKLYKAFEKYYLCYLKDEAFVFRKINSENFLLLKYLNSEKSPEELVQFLTESGCEEIEIQKIISEGIRDQIIVCIKG